MTVPPVATPAANVRPAPRPTPALSPRESKPPASDRLRFIDGMRALAALMVFAFHLSPSLSPSIKAVAGKGWVGVEVFFVLSGFVIAYTVGDARITPAYFGSFVLRRSLRLDPPYWIAIAVTLLLIPISQRMFSDSALEFPSAVNILDHVFYLQGIAGFPHIIDVLWSLCIEIQLYLVFVVGLALVQVTSSRINLLRRHEALVAFCMFTALAAVSLLGELGVLAWKEKTWFLSFWHEFFLGAMVAWLFRRRVSPGAFVAYLALMVAALALLAVNFQLTATTATGCVLAVAGWRGWLRNGLNLWGLQLLGRTSYGFYLIHTLILARTSRLLMRLGLASEDNVVVIGSVGFVLSFLGAYLLYRFVETPCVRFARRFKVC
jgi:peptidoglycan/LPS O-acetylase OafA/YrhL